MVRLTLPETKLFRYGIAAIEKLITDAMIEISPEKGFQLIAMDPSNIAMVIWTIRPEAFSEFEVEEATKFGISIGHISPIIKRIKAKDTLTLSLEENTLKLTLHGAFKRVFTAPLLGEFEREYPEPNIEFKVDAEMDADVIKEAVRDIKIISDAMKIEADEDKIVMSAEGELKKARIELTRDSPALISLNVKEPSKASYSIDYLSKIATAAQVSDTLGLKFATDWPARFEFKALERMNLTFILAPRIE